MSLLSNLSVVIPVGPEEQAWKELVDDLIDLPLTAEILFVGAKFSPDAVRIVGQTLALSRTVKWITSKLGRADQMNAGADQATKEFIWFLHSDSRFTPGTLTGLESSLEKFPDSLHFFKLRFSGHFHLAKINEFGVLLRSRYLKLPFGDQGFCLKKTIFEKLGKFPVGQPYGEDHLLVWKAHQMKVKLAEIPTTLATSPRNYEERGWLKTTVRHLYLTCRQAAPELIKLRSK